MNIDVLDGYMIIWFCVLIKKGDKGFVQVDVGK